ncbi:MAG: hypothetical protein IPP61_13205 [Cytophagaceae bacterium]|nr:hypothetical protein [Cytophagaceae bacterium]MBK9933018.1 hypothetical protein [Cytophagaceae bacterium]MBL0303265.1 hypothetical protein [Cytophagaceae bacterium]MBL0326117.1 hypothetical protein [Cytophagaceae bacterium]
MKQILIILFLFSLVSCSTSDDSSVLADTANITGQKWKLTEYTDKKGRNKTSVFSSYYFVFANDGVAEVHRADNSIFLKGTYKIFMDSGREKFEINLPINDDDGLSELNEDWKTVSRTSEKIELQNESGGGGGTDFVKFEKL